MLPKLDMVCSRVLFRRGGKTNMGFQSVGFHNDIGFCSDECWPRPGKNVEV
jgi:hypothetical protein